MSEKNSPQVRSIYMEDNRELHSARVTKVGRSEFNKKHYNWIQLDETIFHPKGGGQPSDEGRINGVKVVYVHKDFPDRNRMDSFEIYHCFESDLSTHFKVGDEVKLELDTAVRQLHSRLHTAGHVLAEASSKCFPEIEGYQGNHYPNNSYVKFKMLTALQTEDKETIKQKVSGEIAAWINQNVKVEDKLESSGIRSVKVFEKWSPCGGTHVKNLKDIGQIEISDLSINKKENTITIKYSI